MLHLVHPPGYEAERLYSYDVILREFLGLPFVARAEERNDVCITLGGEAECGVVRVADVLFQTPQEAWLTEHSMPERPLAVWDGVPVLYGRRLADGAFFREEGNELEMALDVFGSAFFMLTRYEEAVSQVRDERDRFPAKASLAWQEGFLRRPIVNEYAELLWQAMQRLWPGLERKKRDFRVRLTHDVDAPLSSMGRSFGQVLKNAAGDVMKRRDFSLATQRIRSYVGGGVASDPYNTFDFLMDLSERNGLCSAFYFITDHTAGEIDGTYSMDDPWIRELMREMHERGHEIGLHPSYGTFRDPAQIRREFGRLLKAAEEEGIRQDEWGGRQHFLRWDVRSTWEAWEDAGLAYDSTLSFAEEAGFRCGTCYEFPVFSLQKREVLRLRERPLLVMEQSLLNESYMNLSVDQAHVCVEEIREQCRKHGGDFVMLWHNSQLVRREHLELYRRIVEG